MRLFAKFHQGVPMVGTHNVHIENMPADATEKDLARFGKYEGYMFDRPKYPSLQGALHTLQRRLSNFGEYTLNTLPRPYTKYVRMWAHFTDPQAAANACEALHRFCPPFAAKEH